MANAPSIKPHAAPPTYADLEALPDDVKGEIVDGELLVQPRARSRHQRIASRLAGRLVPAFDFDDDDGGSGGWVILIEPGIELPRSPEVAPDLAAWRAERFVEPPANRSITTTPDWICEILSPTNRRIDLQKKMPFYARVGVEWAWLVDPMAQSIAVKRNVDGRWTDVATFVDDDRMKGEPFAEAEIPLATLWSPIGRGG